MAEDGKHEGKWEGKVSAKLKTPITAEQVWPLLADFCNLHKWHPDVATCHPAHAPDAGPAQAGAIRYCASRAVPPEAAVKWARERLIEIDPIGRRLRYEVQDNNVGFTYWIATMGVAAVDGGGCEIEWSFVGEPPEGWSYGDVLSYYEFCIKSMANKMEHALLN